MSNIKKYLTGISVWKTLFFNFKYLDFRSALRLPVLVSRKVRFKTVKGHVDIAAPLHTGMIRLGFDSCGIFDAKRSRSIWEVAGDVVFKGNYLLGNGFKICVLVGGGRLVFGDKFTMTAESQIVAAKEISFGSDCLLSWNILIMDTDFHKIYDSNGCRTNFDKPVKIGDHVWIGCRSMILKGSCIPTGAVIAAGSKVAGKLKDSNCIYGKEPIRTIAQNIAQEH